VLLSAAFAVDPVRDAATLAPVTEAALQLSTGYLALAPFSDVLDTLTLLTVRQHIALLVSLLVVFAVYRVWRRRTASVPVIGDTSSTDHTVARRRGVLRETGYAALFLLTIIAVYAIGALAPRPMAAIALTPSDLYLSLDVHSHTRFSHDGRRGWEPADVRAWHRAAGFDVAYVSDHRTFEGAEHAVAENPPQAGGETILLQALELVWRGEHVNVLGAGRVYKGLTNADLRDMDEEALVLTSAIPGREPVVIETIPGNPEKIVAAAGPGTPGVRAIELVDGAPRGLTQSRLQRSRLVAIADSLNLAIVAGSDNHGWGRTAPAWTLLRIPGWRGMSPDSLAFNIERTLRLGGREASRVVERRVAGEINGRDERQLAFTLPAVFWRMLTTLSSDERVMWIVWTWAVALVVLASHRWRRRRLRVA
jgi:hypothetical protein